MRTRRMVVVTAAVVLGMTGAPAAPVAAGAAVRPYRMVDLRGFGGAESEATAINASGQVVGYGDLPSGDRHAFLWSHGRLTDLGTLGGANATAADINAAGQVVGFSDTAAGESHAFLWFRGRMTDLGTLGRPFSRATAINDAGTVVGGVYGPNNLRDDRAFVWQAGRMTLLAGLPGSGVPGSGFREELLATGINNAGDIVGLGKNRTALARWQAGVPTVLFEVPSFLSISEPRINNPGDVLAFWSPSHTGTVLFWRAGSTTPVVRPLGDGVTAANARGINDRHQFVGGYSNTTNIFADLPYVSRGDSSVLDLRTLGVAEDARLLDINNRGQIAGAAEVGSSLHPVVFLR